MQSSGDKREYWKKNLIYVGALLAIWFLVSFGFGILLVEPLNVSASGGSNSVFGLLSKAPCMCSSF